MRILIAAFLFVLMAIVLPALLVTGAGRGDFVFVVLSLSLIAYGAIRVVFGIVSPRPSLLVAMYGVFVYMNLGLAPLLQAPYRQFPWPSNYSDGVILGVYACLGWGCLAFELGVWLAQRKGEGRILFIDKIFMLPCSIPRLNFLCLAGIPLLGGLFLLTGWHHALFVSRSEVGVFAVGTLSTSPLVVIALTLLRLFPLVITVLLGLLLLEQWRASSREKKGGWPIVVYIGFLFFYGLMAVLITNPVSSPRYWVATVWGGILITGMHFIKIDARRWFPVVLLLGYLVVFPIADHFRRSLDSDKAQAFVEGGIFSGIRNNLRGGDFDGFQQIANAISVSQENGFTWGRQLAGTVLNFVPRSMWGGKPEQTGAYLAYMSGYNYYNLSCPLWAEGYVDFSWIGTFVYLFLCGYGLVMIERGRAREGSCSLGAILAIIFSCYSIFFLRGALMNVAPFIWTLASLLLFLCFRISSDGQRALRPRPIRGEFL